MKIFRKLVHFASIDLLFRLTPKPSQNFAVKNVHFGRFSFQNCALPVASLLFKLYTLTYLRSNDLVELHTKLHHIDQNTRHCCFTRKWGLEGIPLWMRLFVLHKKLLQFFQTKNYKIQKILEDINFILHLSYLSDSLGVVNNCNCYIQGPGSNIVDFAITLTTSGVGTVLLASHIRLFDPWDLVLQLFLRNIKDLFCFAIVLTPPISSSCVVENFFCSLTYWH